MNRPLSRFALILLFYGSFASLPGQEPAEPQAASETPRATSCPSAPRSATRRSSSCLRTSGFFDSTCGDKDYWIVDGNENFAFVKPAKAGAATNVNLVTAAGNVYSFVLTEVSERGGEPDLKGFVEPTDASTLSAAAGEPRFVPSSQIADYRQQIELAKTEARQAKEQARQLVDKQVSEFRSSYPSALEFNYKFQRDRKPFFVDAIYHDGRFTYIQASPEETPALYELKDGKPNLVNFELEDGTFVVPKVLQTGYPAIGRQKLGYALAN